MARRDLGADEIVCIPAVVGGDNLGLDRGAPGRHLIDDRSRHLAVEGERQRARDRRRGHGQEVRAAAALGSQQLALPRAKPVLLVHDRQTEVHELHVVLDESMRAHDQRGVT